ncbi:MAG: hypothetical protein MZV65_20725 [Chromatiales bacterium]|nr:hypothetical protein [Chromatiales bacterium]
MSKDKLWGGRFSQPTDTFVEEFTASIDFDKRLYRQDIRGSIAHARMLGRQEIIPQADVDAIVSRPGGDPGPRSRPETSTSPSPWKTST